MRLHRDDWWELFGGLDASTAGNKKPVKSTGRQEKTCREFCCKNVSRDEYGTHTDQSMTFTWTGIINPHPIVAPTSMGLALLLESRVEARTHTRLRSPLAWLPSAVPTTACSEPAVPVNEPGRSWGCSKSDACSPRTTGPPRRVAPGTTLRTRAPARSPRPDSFFFAQGHR